MVTADLGQLCTVDDMTGEEPCRRLAQWQWQPGGPGTHPVFLCNFHAEPLTSSPALMRKDEP
jgi:hypothetical protein